MSTIEAEQSIWSLLLRRKKCAWSEPLSDGRSMTATASVSKSSGRQPVSIAQKASTIAFALSDSSLMSSKAASPLKAFRLIFFERLLWLLNAFGQRAFRESLKIGQTRVAPIDCVALLNLKFLCHRGVTFRVDRAGQ